MSRMSRAKRPEQSRTTCALLASELYSLGEVRMRICMYPAACGNCATAPAHGRCAGLGVGGRGAEPLKDHRRPARQHRAF
eukprot:7924895-Pyramimonas_sp.AAC.1